MNVISPEQIVLTMIDREIEWLRKYITSLL